MSAPAVSTLVTDPIRPWARVTVAELRDDLERAEGLAAVQRELARTDTRHAAVYQLTIKRADERAAAYRAALAEVE